MDITAFLKTVITTDEGWFELLIGPPNGEGAFQEWFHWPEELPKIVESAMKYRDANNVYFSSHLFNRKDSHKPFVLPSRTIQADLDDAMPPTMRPPSVLVETSPGRHQGFWLYSTMMPPEQLEGLSRATTYGIPQADRSGWSVGHKMRVPDTFNHKYEGPPRSVRVIASTLAEYDPDVTRIPIPAPEPSWTPEPIDGSVRELWVKTRKNVPKDVRDAYDKRAQDRSAALFRLTTALFRQGLNRDEVFAIAQQSANNKFADNKYHADIDLAKDVLRAERAVQLNDIDGMTDIERVKAMRALAAPIDDRRKFIAEHVQNRMSQMGSFVTTDDGTDWYILETEGRPTTLSRRNDYLASILETRFALNGVETEQKYTINFLISAKSRVASRGTLGILSHFDPQSNRVLLHTGGREVLQIDSKGISTATNGDFGLIFPWRSGEALFEPDFRNPLSVEGIFDGCFDNLIEMEPVHALAIMRAWLLFLLTRNAAASRPLLALFGQPGSGKSTMFKRMLAFLYGPGKSLNSITSPEDFDHAVSTDPFVAFDQIDQFPPAWLPDKLALSAAQSVLQKRKLYSDNDSVHVVRQALIGVTAHNPQFRREDIVDRFLMFNFRRLDKFIPESSIIGEIVRNRNRLWGGLVNDLQAMLATSMPSEAETPAFRVSDFARIGLWAARALGFESDFRQAITSNTGEQMAFNLEEEDLLVETIKRWLAKSPDPEHWYSVADLWSRWSLAARDAQNFERTYRNAQKLGRKLWALHATLKSVFDIEFRFDETEGKRLWRIRTIT